MASPSSSSMATPQSCISYDVFLSFRGEDTRDGFTDHLYTALKQAGIRTFRDDTMERGKLLKPELKKAIQESAISLIVFSEGYASSKWCLDEVMMITEEHETSSFKHQFVPVFYKVDPSDVGNQRGSFKEAFDAYDDEIKAETNLEKKRELLEKVGAWRDSLNKAATFTGLVYEDGYESKFIINILNVVIKKVDNKALHIEGKIVGIKDHLAEIESWLQDPSPDAVVLLIDGMGGIGKSTIAKCIYNSNSRNYDGCCFLADICKETLNQTSALCRLQSQLISTIKKNKKEETIWNVDEGTIEVTKAISNKKVLLILDDVATLKQLNALLGPKKFYPGSKVIITTRCRDLSTAFKDHGKVHSVGTLSMGDATELFSLHAFDQHQPVEPYIGRSELVVQRCKGLPLALKVLGSSLREKTNEEWDDTMHKLASIPHPEIQEVLQISYETLADDKDKDLFLLIACFLEGQEKDYIVKVLTECNLHPVTGIKNLMDRCLLHFEGERVMMHQLIKEMGREVVRHESPKDPGKRSRLWDHQDCIDVLQDHTGTEHVEGLMLHMPWKMEASRGLKKYFNKKMPENFQIGALEKMKNLMLLQLKNVTFSGKYKKFPKKLRLLSWHGFSLKAIPGDVSLEKLVVLDMSCSKLKRVWDDFKYIGSLKTLNLSYSVELIETPDFGGLPNLESLILRNCYSLIKVGELVPYLRKLDLLDLTFCANLRCVPCLPASLKSLKMDGCTKLKVLGSIANLTELGSLDLGDCKSLRDVPCLPTSLKSLQMSRCKKLEGLGPIANLTKLGSLDLGYCESLRDVPCLPTSLRSLKMYGCKKLEVLGSMANLTELGSLDLTNCESLRDLPCFPRSLTLLQVSGCKKLEVLGPIANLTKVGSLDLGYCESLRDVPCLPTSLKSLKMYGCKKLEVLGSIANLTELGSLDLTNCESLRALPCLPRSLESLQMSGCGVLGRVQCLDPISSLSLLTEVILPRSNLFDNCFPNDWSSLVSLRKLNIDGNKITFLPECVQTLPRIEELRVAHCSQLQSVLGVPKSVNELFVNDNESLEKVQPAEFSRTVVHHMNCPKLCEIEGRYKTQSIDKVEKKLVQYLGLESNADEGIDMDIEVFHEFGIFSTFVSEKQIPSSSCFTYKEMGSQISFKVPMYHNRSRIIGFNMCAVLSLSFLQIGLDLEIGVQNKTKDLLWSYFKRDQNIRKNAGKFALLSLWRCGNLLEGGDEIVIRVFSRLISVEECCINLIYEDDDQILDGGKHEAHDVNGFDQMSWTDRMDKDTSNYVCPGKTHVFRDDRLVYNGKKGKWEGPTISFPSDSPQDRSEIP